MQYRKFPNLNWQVSALGMGCMRLPVTDNLPASGSIDEKQAIEMIRYAVDSGVNYLDTAYTYHEGKSEVVLGKALKNGYRDKIKLATKAPMILIKTAQQYNDYLDEQLKKLDVEMIDFHLFHGLSKERWKVVQDEELLYHAEQAQKAGKIAHIGFSFHDAYEVFEQVLNGYDKWMLCQIQYNYMDTHFQAGQKGLQLAASKGIAVVVMEPLRGGKLANPTDELQQMFKEAGYEKTAANLGLQWVWNHPEVTVVLSGMSTKEQIRENIQSADRATVGGLTEKEKSLVQEIRRYYETRPFIPCTGCSYCMPCPQGINIPYVLKLFSGCLTYQYYADAIRLYAMFVPPEQRTSRCINCKQCEAKCPQGIKISSWMPQIDEKLKGEPRA